MQNPFFYLIFLSEFFYFLPESFLFLSESFIFSRYQRAGSRQLLWQDSVACGSHSA